VDVTDCHAPILPHRGVRVTSSGVTAGIAARAGPGSAADEYHEDTAADAPITPSG
jgi:hypothetical protein